MRGTHKFEGSYFKAAWALLTRDKGWIKPVLALTAAGFIPLFGQVAQLGYGLEWARLTAWGIDAAPKQRGVSVGAIIKSGFRGLGVILGLTAIFTFLSSIVLNIFSGVDWLYSLVSFLSSVLMLYVSVIALMAALRAAIYQRIGAGFQADRLWDMLSADFNGITWIVLGNLGWSILMGIVSSILGVLFTLAAVPSFGSLAMWITNLTDGAAVTGTQLAQILRQLVTVYAPLVVVETMLLSLASTLLTLVVLNALGLWLRQFNVPNCGAFPRTRCPLRWIPRRRCTPARPCRSRSSFRPRAPSRSWSVSSGSNSSSSGSSNKSRRSSSSGKRSSRPSSRCSSRPRRPCRATHSRAPGSSPHSRSFPPHPCSRLSLQRLCLSSRSSYRPRSL